MFHADALPGFTFFTYRQTNPLEFEGHLFVCNNDFIEVVCNFPRQPGPRYRKANAEITFLHGFEALQDGGEAFRHWWFQCPSWIAVISILPADGRFNGRGHAGCSWTGSDHSA